MNNWRITSLRLGELYLPHEGGIMRDLVHCWLVQNGETNLLVDTGMAEIGVIRDRLKVEGFGGGHDALRRELGREGLTLDDIDYIVLTHMHFDHADNLDLFPRACVVVQRNELFSAIDPVPSQRIFYWKSSIANLEQRKRPAALRLIDGDVDLLPGIRLLSVPSHTEGMQVVIVTTDKGRAAIVSDLGGHYRYWYPADVRATDKPQRSLERFPIILDHSRTS